MPDQAIKIEYEPLQPPAPALLDKDLSTWQLFRGVIQSSLGVWPKYAFETGFNIQKRAGITSVLVNDLDGIKHVLATNRENYRRPTSLRRVAMPLGGDGLFLSEGENWKRQRRMMSPTFTPKNLDVLVPHFHDAAQHMLSRMQSVKVNLSREFQDAALETVLRALFSMPESQERHKLDKLVRAYADGPGRTTFFDAFAKKDTDFPFTLVKRRQFQSAWFGEIERIIEGRKLAKSNDAPSDLLDLLLSLSDQETGEKLTTAEIRDQCATMFFAGSETTARLMFWATYLIALDQNEQSRIRTEIATFPPSQVHTLQDLKNWPRLRNVLFETMRLYPPLPHILRQAIGTDKICGHNIPKNAQVWISPWVLHRHTKYWDKPQVFDPDRFENISAPWVQKEGYIPFGFGPRICIGLHFAMAEAQIILARLLAKNIVSCADKSIMPIGQISIQPDREPVFELSPV